MLARGDGWRWDLNGQLAVLCDGHLGFNGSHVAASSITSGVDSVFHQPGYGNFLSQQIDKSR
jgi:hypothetical protein